jgi:acyl carrier protein
VAELERSVLAEIRRVFANELEREGPVEPHHELARDLEVDSMGALILAVALEDRFRIRLADEDAGAVATVGDLVELVARRVRGQSPADAERGNR